MPIEITAEHINAFVTPFISVMEKEIPASAPISVGSMYIKCDEALNFDISIYCMINGYFKGRVVMGLSVDTAMEIAEGMMQRPVDSFDRMAQSAITELINMIVGNAGIKLNKQSIDITISPPRLVFDSKYNVSTPECPEPIAIPINTKIGDIDLYMVIVKDEKEDI